MGSEKPNKNSPREKYQHYQEVLEEIEGPLEFREVTLNINDTEQKKEKIKKETKDFPLKPRSKDLEDVEISIDPLFYDPHWDYFKEVLDFYYPSKNLRKYYCGILPISSYMDNPKSELIKGEYSEKLIKGIMKMYPDEHKCDYTGVNNKDLVLKEWKNVKLAHFIFFEENKDLIFNRYMKNIKDFTVRIRSDVFRIPNITVLATPAKPSTPSYFKNMINMVELSNLKSDLDELAAFESFRYGCKYEYNLLKQSVTQKIQKLNNHFLNLDRKFLVEIPFYDILCSEITLNKNILPLNAFLDLVKYITFFHQKQREWYEDNSNGKKYLLSHLNDFIYSYQIALHLFMSPISNFKAVKLQFFNYLVNSAEKKKQQDTELKNISIYDIQLEQSKIVNDYPGKKSTLILWLSEFSAKLNILTRSQLMKNAKVYYSLNKVAPLKSNKFESLLEKIRDAYDTRIEKVKNLSSKTNAPITYHQLHKNQKKGAK